MPRDGNGSEFSKVTNLFRDSNGLRIEHAHDNPLLNTQVYVVEYEDKTHWTFRTRHGYQKK